MRRMVEKILNSYGSDLTLCHDGTAFPVKGFLQSGRSVSQRSMEWKMWPLGQLPTDSYVYIGPVMPQVQAGDVLMQGEKEYELRQVEAVFYENTPIYLWGLCVQKGGADTWGS